MRQKVAKFGSRFSMVTTATLAPVVITEEHSFADNIVAGVMAGMQLVMGAIVCATLTWTSGNIDTLTDALPIGISMNVIGLGILIMVTCSLSAFPYALPAIQDTPSLMLGTCARSLVSVADKDMVVNTMLFTMTLLALSTGLLYVLMGLFRICEWVQQLPHSVISGFLGAVGVWVTVSAMALMSGVRFVCIYPTDWPMFFRFDSMVQIALGIFVFIALQVAPRLSARWLNPTAAMRVGHLITFLPLPIFWAIVFASDTSLDTLEERHWIFPRSSKGSVGCGKLWSTMYWWKNVDLDAVWSIRYDLCTFLAVMCLNAVLGFSGIEASGSNEKSLLDHNAEIRALGAANLCAGALSGQCGYHQIPVSVYAHKAGLQNRLGAYAAASVALVVHLSGLPLQTIMPKWFLGGLFLNMGFLFLKQWMYEALFTMPFLEYVQIWIVASVAVWTSFPNAVLVGITISMIVFIRDATSKDPIKSVRRLDRVSHKAMACLPEEDMEVLEEIGHEAVWIAFQGDLYFGNAKVMYDSVVSVLATYYIWDFRDVRSIDVAAASLVRNAASILKQRGSTIVCTQIDSFACRDVLALQGLCEPPQPHELASHSGKQSIARSMPIWCCGEKRTTRLDMLAYRESIEEALSHVNQMLLNADKAMRKRYEESMFHDGGRGSVRTNASSVSATSRSMERQAIRERMVEYEEHLKITGAPSPPAKAEQGDIVSLAWGLIKRVGSSRKLLSGEVVFEAGDIVNETFYAVEAGTIDLLVSMFGYWDRAERVQVNEVFGVEDYILSALNRQQRAVCSSSTAVVWTVAREDIERVKALRTSEYQELQEFLLRMLASAVKLKGRL